MLREAGFVQMSDAWCGCFPPAKEMEEGFFPVQILVLDVSKPISTLCYAQGTWFMTELLFVQCQYLVNIYIYMFLTECIKSHASSSNIRRNKDVRPRGQQHLQYCDGRNGHQLIAWPWLRQTSEQREKYKVPAWCLEACSC